MTYGRHSKGQSAPEIASREVRPIEMFGRRDDDAGKPREHGKEDDPRYPSPRHLRQILAFLVDWLIHAGPVIVVFAVFAHNPALEVRQPHATFYAALSWPLLSFVDRTIVQRIFHATIGKALFGLVIIRSHDGGWPTFGRLVKVWLFGLIHSVVFVGDLLGSSGAYGLDLDIEVTAVRRKDVRDRQHNS